MPELSVVVCTRDRGERVKETLRSIVAGCGTGTELIVIDQSERPIDFAAGQDDHGFRHVVTRTRGLSQGRNLGLQLARGPLVAFTDDDCVVDRSWGDAIRRAFGRDPRIALVFGNVEPANVDRSSGFVPAYRRTAPHLATDLSGKAGVEGMGACMAARRDVALELGGFDPHLGVGTRLAAGEDVDFTIRVLGAGYAVYETPEISVVHHGFRPWSERRNVVRAYWLGAGAAIGKHLRQRPMSALALLARLGWRFVFARSAVAESLGPQGLAVSRLTAFGRGLAAGVRLPRVSLPLAPRRTPRDGRRSPVLLRRRA